MFQRIAGLFLALITTLAAQDPAAPTKPKGEGGIQVRVLAEQAPEALGKVCLVFGESKSDSFTLPTNSLSSPIAVPARTMALKMVDKDVTLCPITLPEAGKAFAIILVRTDDPAFKAGDVLFINRSEKTILAKLGDTPLAVKPGTTQQSRPTGPKENTYYDIALGTRDESGDKVLSTTRWPIDNTLRSYLFFFTGADGRTTFRSVDEFVPPAK